MPYFNFIIKVNGSLPNSFLLALCKCHHYCPPPDKNRPDNTTGCKIRHLWDWKLCSIIIPVRNGKIWSHPIISNLPLQCWFQSKKSKDFSGNYNSQRKAAVPRGKMIAEKQLSRTSRQMSTLSLSYACKSGSFRSSSFRNVTKSQPDLNFVFPLQISQSYSRQKSIQC